MSVSNSLWLYRPLWQKMVVDESQYIGDYLVGGVMFTKVYACWGKLYYIGPKWAYETDDTTANRQHILTHPA